jgi:hypothetical protein
MWCSGVRYKFTNNSEEPSASAFRKKNESIFFPEDEALSLHHSTSCHTSKCSTPNHHCREDIKSHSNSFILWVGDWLNFYPVDGGRCPWYFGKFLQIIRHHITYNSILYQWVCLVWVRGKPKAQRNKVNTHLIQSNWFDFCIRWGRKKLNNWGKERDEV